MNFLVMKYKVLKKMDPVLLLKEEIHTFYLISKTKNAK